MSFSKHLHAIGCLLVLVLGLVTTAPAQFRDPAINGRSGGHTIFGDIHVAEPAVKSSKTVSFDIVLYAEGRTIVARESISGNGRYRFNNIPSGLYDIVIEVEGESVAQVRVDARSPLVEDIRQDLDFEWRSNAKKSTTGPAVLPAETYQRNSTNAALVEKADKAVDAKQYDEAAKLLKKVVESDPKDFPVWTELGNLHFLQNKYSESENEYFRAIDLNSSYFPALLNLGRTEVILKQYAIAVDVLSRAIKVRSDSADANYFLGESYLQLKKGSVAVGYLNEALRLDPKGMVEVHLRLALLYHAAGMMDKAAAEYEVFLKQRPDYQDRKTLEDYISANKKP